MITPLTIFDPRPACQVQSIQCCFQNQFYCIIVLFLLSIATAIINFLELAPGTSTFVISMVLPVYSIFFSIAQLFDFCSCLRCCDGKAANEEAAPIDEETVAPVSAQGSSNDALVATEDVHDSKVDEPEVAGEGEYKEDVETDGGPVGDRDESHEPEEAFFQCLGF